jgi:hypothetical protein
MWRANNRKLFLAFWLVRRRIFPRAVSNGAKMRTCPLGLPTTRGNKINRRLNPIAAGPSRPLKKKNGTEDHTGRKKG